MVKVLIAFQCTAEDFTHPEIHIQGHVLIAFFKIGLNNIKNKREYINPRNIKSYQVTYTIFSYHSRRFHWISQKYIPTLFYKVHEILNVNFIWLRDVEYPFGFKYGSDPLQHSNSKLTAF